MPPGLEDLAAGAVVEGVVDGEPVTVAAVEWHGSSCVTLTYRTSAGDVDHQLVYRSDEDRLGLIGLVQGEVLDEFVDALVTSWPELVRLAACPASEVQVPLS